MRRALALLVAAPLAAVAAPPRGWDDIGPKGGEFISIAPDPQQGANVAILADEGLYLTRDRGATWTQQPLPCAQPKMAAVRGASVYMNCGYVLLRSRDDGRTWAQYSRRDWSTMFFSGAYESFVVHPADANTAAVFAGISDLELTRDGGSTWVVSSDPARVDGQGLFGMTFDPSTPSRLLGMRFTSYTGTGTRTDLVENPNPGSGGAWTVAGTPFDSRTESCFGRSLVADSAGVVYMAMDCGLAISRDRGHSWEFHQASEVGITTPTFSSLRADPNRSGRVFAREYDRIVLTEDAGFSWRTFASGVDMDAAFGADGTIWMSENGSIYRYDAAGRAAMPVARRRVPFVGSAEIAGANGEVLFAQDGYVNAGRSTNDGATWAWLDYDQEIRFVRAVPGQPSTLYGASREYARPHALSLDAGLTWQRVEVATPPEGYSGLAGFQPVGPQPGVVYASWQKTEVGSAGEVANVSVMAVRSVDGGRTFAPIGAGIGEPHQIVSAAPGDPQTAYVSTPTGLFRTSDAGRTWRRIWQVTGGTIPAPPVVDVRDARILYTDVGTTLWASDDGGDHWREAAAPDPARYISTIVPDPVDAGRAFAISLQGDVFETRDAARSWTRLAVGGGGNTAFGMAYGLFSPRVGARGADRIVVGGMDVTIVYRNVTAPHPLAVGTDLWFNPAQSGWGLSITQHDGFNLFAIWFTYDANGEPRWFFMPGGEWADNSTFRATLYSARTAPGNFFASTFDPAAVVKTAVGDATLRFTDTQRGTVTFAMYDGTRVVQPMQRMAFGPVEKIQQPLADLWWNPAESGWGITLHQQYSTMFATWFVFDAHGEATWLNVPNARMNMTPGNARIEGDLYRARSAAGFPYAAKSVVNSKVGTWLLTPGSPPSWSLTATSDGVTSSKAISPLPF